MLKYHQIFQLKLCTMAHNFQLSVGYKIFKQCFIFRKKHSFVRLKILNATILNSQCLNCKVVLKTHCLKWAFASMTTIQTMAENFYGLTKIDFRLSKNALWDACAAQWPSVINKSLMLNDIKQKISLRSLTSYNFCHPDLSQIGNMAIPESQLIFHCF